MSAVFLAFARAVPPSPAIASPRRVIEAVWLIALWLAGPGNLPLWQNIWALDDTLAHRLALLVGLGLVVASATAALLSLLAWPRVLRPAATLLILVAAFNTHFMWQYGAVIDPTMMANVVHTDAREVRDLLSLRLLGTALLGGGITLALAAASVTVSALWPAGLMSASGLYLILRR